MSHARTALLSCSVLLLLATASAWASPPIIVRWGTPVGARQAKGAVAVVREGRPTEYVRLGASVRVTAPAIFSTTNANDRFNVWVELPGQAGQRWPYLIVDGAVFMASSTGFDSTKSTATFDVARAEASRLAALWSIPMAERTRLDEGLRYEWRLGAAPRVGEALPVVLRISNQGTTTVRVMLGGRQRGVRDNRFSFAATLDGVPLPVTDAPDFGGLSTNQRLSPGQSLEVRATDLGAWVTLTHAGALELRCHYDGELFPDTDDSGQWPGHAHEKWDVAVDGLLTAAVAARVE